MFSSDKPIYSKANDSLNRTHFSKQIANAILSYDSTDNFTISLCGPWGSGKTSVVNMIEEEIKSISSTTTDEKEKPVIIKFNPWNYSNNDQLLSQFFATINSEIKSFNKTENFQKIGDALEKYSQILEYTAYIPTVGPYLKIIPSLFKSAGKQMEEMADQENTISNQKNKIVKLLQEEKRKFIVIIDDIDRLSNQQICMIFQLVNSIAGFPNMVYLLAFDKKIVCRALEEVQRCNGLEYLEKIIQVPFDIPMARKSDLEKILFDKLDEIVENDNYDNDYWSEVFLKCITPFIKTIRDINRVINVFKFKYDNLHTELNWIDLLAITVLEIFEPKVYEWVYQNESFILGVGFEYGILQHNNESKTVYDEYLKDIEAISLTDSKIVIEFLQTIFPTFSRHTGGHSYSYKTNDELRSMHRIASENRFKMYFNMSLIDISVSEVDVLNSINNMSQSELRSYFEDLSNNETLKEYIGNLRGNVSLIKKDKLPIFIEELLRASNYEVNLNYEGFFGISAANDCWGCVYLICEKLKHEELTECLLKLLSNANDDSLADTIELVYCLEKRNGEFNKDERKGFLNLNKNEISIIDEKVEECINSISDKCMLLSSGYFKTISILWKKINTKSYNEFIDQCLKVDQNIPLFLLSYYTIWDDEEKRGITFKKEYEELICKDDVYNAVLRIKNTDAFNRLDIKCKQVVIAFYQWYNLGEKDYHEQTNFDILDSLISDWEVIN